MADSNENNYDDILISRDEQVTYDFSAILMLFAVLIYAEHDKANMFQVLREIHSQDIQLSQLLKSRTDLAQTSSDFFDKRSEEYRNALKLKTLFGFLKPEQLVKQANEYALNDTRDFMNIVALSSDPLFQDIMKRRDRIANMLVLELIRLIRRGESIVIRPEKIKDVMAWLKSQKFLT